MKIGDKVMVQVRVIEVVENEKGVHYVVVPADCRNDYNTMKIKDNDIAKEA